MNIVRLTCMRELHVRIIDHVFLGQKKSWILNSQYISVIELLGSYLHALRAHIYEIMERHLENSPNY